MQENGDSPHDESENPSPEEGDALADAYESPFGAPSGEEEIVVAEVVEPAQRKPRIWTVACVGLLTLPIAIFVVGGVVAFVAIADAGVEVLQNGGFKSWFEDYSQTRLGLAVLVLPGQAVFLVMAVGAAVLSPQPLSQRLGLWLGAVAWRADSVLPAMLCHAANNTLAVAAMKYGQMQTLDLALDPMTMAALVISLPAFLLSLYIFRSN